MRTMTAPATIPDPADQRVERMVADHMVEPTSAPRGRKGLWVALADTVTPRISERALPLGDAALVGELTSMFDYDPALAAELEPG
jgi:hypothetical protein